MKITGINSDLCALAVDIEVAKSHSYLFKGGIKSHNSMKGILEASSPTEVDAFIVRSNPPKRPETLPCDIHYVHANNQDFIVLAGLLNGSVYEIFVDEKNGHDFGAQKTGKIIKKSKGEYTLLNADGEILLEGLSKNFHGTWGILTRCISLLLRQGSPLTEVIEQLQRSKEFLGFEKAVSRVLKYYVKEGEKLELHEECPTCKNPLIYQTGCKTCPACGWAACS